MEREHGNAEDRFTNAVREHTDTRADEDVDNRPIFGHLLINSSYMYMYTRTSHVRDLFALPNDHINKYF